MPIIGLLNSSSADAYAPFLAAFREGLNEAGFLDGRNFAMSFVGRMVATIGCRRWLPTWRGASQARKSFVCRDPYQFLVPTAPVNGFTLPLVL